MPIAQFEIGWDDGSGDKLYLTPHSGVSGTTQVSISSDANATGVYRTVQVKFYVTAAPETFAYLNIKQSAVGDLWVIGQDDKILGKYDKAIGKEIQ